MRTIVVGYDGTSAAERALQRAAELATALGAKLVVTHVTPTAGVISPGWRAVEAAHMPELDLRELDRAEAILAEQGIEAEYQPAIGEPADAIVEVAALRGADLIVVGTRRPNPLQRLLGHSVSETVSRLADCDVLIVR